MAGRAAFMVRTAPIALITLAAACLAASCDAGAGARKPARPPGATKPAANPVAEWEAIEREAALARDAVAREPRNERARQKLAELAIQAARAAERALSRGDDGLFGAYREQLESRFHDTRWRMDRMAGRGDGAADFALGVLALHGILQERDAAKACARFDSALSRGFSGAKFRQAECIEGADPQRAAGLYLEAAEAGHVAAIERVGRACLDATPPDPGCAHARLERAAREGRASAKSLLAWLHAEGTGVRQDLARAVALYREAAAQGDVSAQNNLGELIEHGRGVVRDERAAFGLYRRAAEAGFPPAQFNLGRLYAGGKGTERNEAEARRWLGEAGKAGIERAARIVEWLDREAEK